MQNPNIIAITGPTSGIGTETVRELSKQESIILLLVRDTKKAEALVEELNAAGSIAIFDIIHCDLADLKTVTKAAAQIREKYSYLDTLINNAGGIFPDRHETVDGFEMTVSVNHLGHFLLTMELIDLLQKSRNPRIINVSSMAHRGAPANLEDINRKKGYSAFGAYADVKLFNILFTKSIHERFQLPSFCLHPGVVKTNFAGEYKGIFAWFVKIAQVFMISAQSGAKTSIYLATVPGIEKHSGAFFDKCKVRKPSAKARDKDLRDQLWHLSENLLSRYFTTFGKENLTRA